MICTGSTSDRALRCTSPEQDAQSAPSAGGSSRQMSVAIGMAGSSRIIGNQGLFVYLSSSNIQVFADTMSFDVTVQNLLTQALGTTDGVTLDAEGVKVFFHMLPVVTGGVGTIAVANADGTGTFTAVNQPYFEYGEVLSSNETSGAKTWKLQFTGAVTFYFEVFVVAPLQFPNGYIDVTPDADSMAAGSSSALNATVRQWNGLPTADQTVSWGTTDGAVATVDGSGLVTGIAPGQAQITATQGPRTGSAALAICPNLAVGEVYRAAMPGASSVCFSGSASGAEYTYMPINHSTSSSLSLTVTGSGIVPVTGPPTPQVAATPNGLSRAFGAQVNAQEPTISDYLHWQIQEENRRVALRGRKIETRTGVDGQVIPGGVPAVGDLWSLNVAQGCGGTLDMRTGRVVSITQHAIIVADTTNPPGGFTTAQYDSIGLEFDSIAYSTDTLNFGGPTDLDTNQRVVIFYTRAVNELSPPASSVVVLGFFTARDLFSAAPESCPLSNEGEMFYMLVPDPTGAVNSNVRTVSYVRGHTVGTTGHELQHLINASRRLYFESTFTLEEVWLNEALSHIAEELMFYRTSVGLAPGMNIITSDLTTGPDAPRRVNAFNTYANPNYTRLGVWLQRPDTAGAFKSNDALAVRGVAWAFMRYAADRRGGTQSTFWYDLVNTTSTGLTNVQENISANPETWLSDFTTAMYADDGVAGISSQFQNPSWNYRSLYTALATSYVLEPRALSNGVGLTLSYSRGGGTAYARFGVPAGGFAGVTALSGGVPPTSPYELMVMRTR